MRVAVVVAGAAAVVYGVWLLHAAAAWIVGGLIAVASQVDIGDRG